MEKISPLKEKVELDVPPYTKLEWNHRAIWKCNRCSLLFYRLVRNLYSAIWFYYIPFLALTVNFSIPYLGELLGDFVDDTVAG